MQKNIPVMVMGKLQAREKSLSVHLFMGSHSNKSSRALKDDGYISWKENL